MSNQTIRVFELKKLVDELLDIEYFLSDVKATLNIKIKASHRDNLHCLDFQERELLEKYYSEKAKKIRENLSLYLGKNVILL